MSAPSCGPRALCGWSPPSLPDDTSLKRRVDPLLVGSRPALAVVVVVVALLNVAPHLPTRAGLAVDGLAALGAGAWCSLNYWRCRHAHCLVTGTGWLVLSIFLFAESAIGHSVIGGYEQPVFLGILAAGLIFEACWFLSRSTNTVTPSRRQLH
ncbi:MAG: hypothetical protein ACRDYZ_00950 [Acidimicrobiales bacterium]